MSAIRISRYFSSFHRLWSLLANCCLVTAVGVVWGNFKCVNFRFPLVSDKMKVRRAKIFMDRLKTERAS